MRNPGEVPIIPVETYPGSQQAVGKDRQSQQHGRDSFQFKAYIFHELSLHDDQRLLPRSHQDSKALRFSLSSWCLGDFVVNLFFAVSQ
jgi:hypothetical protein